MKYYHFSLVNNLLINLRDRASREGVAEQLPQPLPQILALLVLVHRPFLQDSDESSVRVTTHLKVICEEASNDSDKARPQCW